MRSGNAEAPDVRIQDTDHVATLRQRDGQVHRHRALADATLAARDGEHSGTCRHLGVGRVLTGVPARRGHDGGALLARHLAPLDAHLAHAWVQADAIRDLALDVSAQWAPADRQLDPDGHDAVRRDVDGGDHAERHDVGAELGIHHGCEDRGHLLGGGRLDGRRRTPIRILRVGHAEILPVCTV
jgi:hypothetical protein